MTFGAADVILFGIRAGLRLQGEARRIYVEHTRERSVVIPLPGIDHSLTASKIRGYFVGNAEGRAFLAARPRLRELHGRAMTDFESFRTDEAAVEEYREFYSYHLLDVSGFRFPDGLRLDDVVALNTIAQWRRGESPHPTALRRIAGTLTEIGIDFFASGPGRGRLEGQSAGRRVLVGVLEALDDHDFVTEGLEVAIEKVVMSTLELIADQPALLAVDPKLASFIGGVARGLIGDLEQRIAALPVDERFFAADRLGKSAQIVFRSLVRNGLVTAVENPSLFLGLDDEGRSAMARRLGGIVIETVMPRDADDFRIGALVSSEGVDALVKGALRVLGEHPGLLDLDGEAIRRILGEITLELSASISPLGVDLFPELARLVLERTATHLDQLWQPGGATGHLAVVAVKTLLAELARPAIAGATWGPKFSKTQLLVVVESTLDELASNPGLISRLVGGKPALAAAAVAVLEALAARPLEGIDAGSAAEIVALGVAAAAERWEMLDALPAGAGSTRLALGAVVGAVLDAVTGGNERARWQLAQGRVVVALVEQSLALLTENGVDDAAIESLEATLEGARARLEAGGRFSIDDFSSELEARLAA